jgi:hypothetical protein
MGIQKGRRRDRDSGAGKFEFVSLAISHNLGSGFGSWRTNLIKCQFKPLSLLLALALVITLGTGAFSSHIALAAEYTCLTICSCEGGSVTTPGEGKFSYVPGTVVYMVASPAVGYRFATWIGDVATIANVYEPGTTITMDGNYSVAANFTATALGPIAGLCFIATAAYGTPSARQIDVLREFRDEVLLKSIAGSQFVCLYYQLSPPIADFIAGNELLRTLVRDTLVDPIVWVIEATGDIWRN